MAYCICKDIVLNIPRMDPFNIDGISSPLVSMVIKSR